MRLYYFLSVFLISWSPVVIAGPTIVGKGGGISAGPLKNFISVNIGTKSRVDIPETRYINITHIQSIRVKDKPIGKGFVEIRLGSDADGEIVYRIAEDVQSWDDILSVLKKAQASTNE